MHSIIKNAPKGLYAGVAAVSVGAMIGSGSGRPVGIAAVGAILSIIVLCRPQVSPQLWMCAAAMFPYWASPTVLGFTITAGMAVGLLVLLAWIFRSEIRLTRLDLLPMGIFAIVLLAGLIGASPVALSASTAFRWAIPYLLGRFVFAELADETGRAFTRLMVPLGLLSAFEFITNFHFFYDVLGGLARPGLDHWAALQMRGSFVRSELSFGHSIALGGTLALGVAYIVRRGINNRRGTLALTGMLFGLLATVSRGATLTIIACVVIGGLGARHLYERRAWKRMSLVLIAIGILTVPVMFKVADSAGAELTRSTDYRIETFLHNVTSMNLLGVADGAGRSARGRLEFGGYDSVDNAPLNIGLTFGIGAGALFIVLLAFHLIRAIRGRGGPWEFAIACQVPILFTVALITQYQEFFWMVEGLCIASIVAEKSRNSKLTQAVHVPGLVPVGQGVSRSVGLSDTDANRAGVGSVQPGPQ